MVETGEICDKRPPTPRDLDGLVFNDAVRPTRKAEHAFSGLARLAASKQPRDDVVSARGRAAGENDADVALLV